MLTWPQRLALPTDEELARGVQRGRRDDLAALVERHHGPLLGYVYRLCGGDRALAEDLTQETFVRWLRAIHDYRYPRPFKAWLYAIATNLARDYFKRAETRRTDSASDQAAAWEAANDPSGDLDNRIIADSETQRVAAAVASLPMHQREAILLRYYHDWPLAEIAQALQVPVGTVKSRLSLGLRRLRALLADVE